MPLVTDILWVGTYHHDLRKVDGLLSDGAEHVLKLVYNGNQCLHGRLSLLSLD